MLTAGIKADTMNYEASIETCAEAVDVTKAEHRLSMMPK